MSEGRNLDAGRLIAGVGALILLISLFLDWYGSPDAGFSGGFDQPSEIAVSAWTAFELIDIVLAGLALATLAWVIETVTPHSSRARLPASVGIIAGPLALVIVLVSIINEPPHLSLIDPDREAGAWIALAGAALMAVGAVLGVARISLVVAARGREAEPGGALPGERRHPEEETRPLHEDRPR